MALLIELPSFIFMDLGVLAQLIISTLIWIWNHSVSFLLYKNCFLEEYEYEKAKGEDIVNFDFCLLFYFIVSTAIGRISKS